MLSDRIASVPPSGTVALADLVKQKKRDGQEIIDLSVGEPDFETPDHIVAACQKALQEGKTHYGPSLGIPELRAAAAQRQADRYGAASTQANVLVTPCKHALLTFFLTVLDPGDEVIIPSPAWVSYAPQVRLCNGKPVHVVNQPTGAVDVEAINEAITEDTRAIVLNSPSNPTGAVQDAATVEALVEIAQDAGIWLLSDEVYSELTADGNSAPSPTSHDQALKNVAVVDGVSKAYAMTGWRIGWLLGPTELIQAATKVQQHSVTHPTLFAQYGALEALTGDQASVGEMRRAFQARRELVVEGLQAAGASFPEPRGAFYLFPTLPGFTSGEALAETLLETCSIACTPGEAFGPGGEGHVRMSYAASQADLELAMERIQALP